MNMSFLSILWRHALWISIPMMCVGAALLTVSILNVVRLVKNAPIRRVPLKEEQEVWFEEAGRVVLCMEGPMLSTRFKGLSYELIGDDGVRVPGSMVLFRARSSGFSKARMSLANYTLPRPGLYLFVIHGLGEPRTGDVDHSFVFAKPYALKSVGYVLAIVFSSLFLVGGLVMFLIRVAESNPGPPNMP